MYIRFVVDWRDKDSDRRQGLFQAAKRLRESNTMSAKDEEQLLNIRAWFNENLERPERMSISKNHNAKNQAISWFKDSANAHISKMREFQEVLERYGIRVHMIKARRLGYILYEDEFQVTAHPFSDTPT